MSETNRETILTILVILVLVSSVASLFYMMPLSKKVENLSETVSDELIESINNIETALGLMGTLPDAISELSETTATIAEKVGAPSAELVALAEKLREIEEAMEDLITEKTVTYGEVLRYTYANDLITNDPHASGFTDTTHITLVTYNRLVRLVGSSTDINPDLAVDWDVSEDGLEYTFYLRQGVQFHDGTPFDATAVKVSFDRVLAMGLETANLKQIESVEIIGKYTVKIKLSTPFAPFLSVLTTSACSILNPVAIEKHKTTDDPWAEKWFQRWTNGTGPYIFDEWEQGVGWSLKWNQLYWEGWEGPHVKRIYAVINLERATTRMMLEKGEIDFMHGPTYESIPAMEANPDLRVQEYQAMSVLYLPINTMKPPTDDVHVRRALSYAFPYDDALALLLGHGYTSRGSLPKDSWLSDKWENIFQYDTDLEKAKEELAKSAYPEGGFELEYVFWSGSEEQRKIGVLFKERLKELNIDFVVSPQEWTVMVGLQTNPETSKNLAALFIFPESADPHFSEYTRFHNSFIPPNGYNWCYYNNTEVSRLLDEGLVEPDPEKRADMYYRIDEILVEEAACIYVYVETKTMVTGTWCHGFIGNPAQVEQYNFYPMYIVEDERP